MLFYQPWIDFKPLQILFHSSSVIVSSFRFELNCPLNV